jgi:uncharacterized protein YxeA
MQYCILLTEGRGKMKKMIFNIVVLLLFSASIIIGCVPTKVQKDQSVGTDKTEKMVKPSESYEDIEEKLKILNRLLKDGLITKDEYYKMRTKVLEKF